jgi:hypothetical protein
MLLPGARNPVAVPISGLYLRPTRIPRKLSCIIVAIVYHPPGAIENSMREHLFRSLKMAESKF